MSKKPIIYTKESGTLNYWLNKLPEQVKATTINVLAEKFGCTSRTIYNICNGTSYMSPVEHEAAAALLHIEKSQLLNQKP